MRLIPESGDEDEVSELAGTLLVAHPVLLDPNFKRSVVLLAAHTPEGGALGVIVNRPLGKTLGEYDPGLGGSDLAGVPLYEGGPVGSDQMILVAWKWSYADGTFKLYFGIDAAKAREILAEDSAFELRGFIGHSGWSDGQLEAEMDEDIWILSPLTLDVEDPDGPAVWRSILSRISPKMRLLADEPEDPSVN
jgi:putative transcriptional regulator